MLLAVAMRILRAREDAEDALHDVFVSLPRGVPLNTVKSRGARGMIAMREALAAAGIKSVDGTND